MATAEEFVASLSQRGATIWSENGQVRVRAPKGTLLPAELEAARVLAKEIFALLETRNKSGETTLKPRVSGTAIPLTELQHLFWSNIVKTPGSLSVRDCVTAAHIYGALNADVLRQSIEIAVERHETLRTRIMLADGLPIQHIDSMGDGVFGLIDTQRASDAEREIEAERLAEAFVGENIDVSKDPLFKALLIRISSTAHVFVLALHQLISDGMSNEILNREIWDSYRSIARKVPLSLPKLPIQFADYAVWQNQTRGQWRELHYKYWIRRMGGAMKTQMRIPGIFVGAPRGRMAIWRNSFANELSEKLRDLARREKTLLAMVVLTVYAVVMFRWCGQNEILVPFLDNGRHKHELEHVVGFITQLFILRISFSPEDNLLDLLRQVKEEFLSACRNGEILRSFEDPAALPLTDLHFNWHPPCFDLLSGHGSLADLGLTVRRWPTPYPVRTALPSVAFLPYFCDTAGGIDITVVYDDGRITQETLELFRTQLHLVAKDLMRDPPCRVESALHADS